MLVQHILYVHYLKSSCFICDIRLPSMGVVYHDVHMCVCKVHMYVCGYYAVVSMSVGLI